MSLEPKGCVLVELLNKFGNYRDVYNFYNGGLPKINKNQTSSSSKTMYKEDRLKKMKGNFYVSSLIEQIIEVSTDKDSCAQNINDILSKIGYGFEEDDESYFIRQIIRKAK